MGAAVPPSPWALVRGTVLYVPMFMALLGLLSGGIMALVEDWPFSDGFFFMAGAITDTANPMIANTPSTGLGCFVEICFVGVEVSVVGAIIGTIAYHPVTSQVVALLEGKGDGDTSSPSASGRSSSGKILTESTGAGQSESSRTLRASSPKEI